MTIAAYPRDVTDIRVTLPSGLTCYCSLLVSLVRVTLAAAAAGAVSLSDSGATLTRLGLGTLVPLSGPRFQMSLSRPAGGARGPGRLSTSATEAATQSVILSHWQPVPKVYRK